MSTIQILFSAAIDQCSQRFYPSLVDLLYARKQCSQCGLRFTEVASTEYRSHLDWHFQLNRKDKDGLRKISRNLFMHPDVSVQMCIYSQINL